MQRLAQPKNFMPVHGEYRMLKLHGEIATDLGLPEENVFVCENGDVLMLYKHKVTREGHVPADDVYIDGKDLDGLSTATMSDRSVLKSDGIVNIIINLNHNGTGLIGDPIIYTRGFAASEQDHVVRHSKMRVQEIGRASCREGNHSSSSSSSTWIRITDMFILASSSPRRKELLRKIIKEFEIIAPDIDESVLHTSPSSLPIEESKAKAYAVAGLYPNDEVLSCDTVVVLDGKVLGKPKSREEAKAMLRLQSGKRQVVLSGYTYISRDIEINRTVATYVYFNELSDELIEEYVSKKKPLDKAGAYGIQDGFPLIDHIEGSFDNVMGLPTEDIYRHVIPRRGRD